MNIELTENNYFRKNDGTFDKNAALKFGGYYAGVCYNEDGYNKVKNEPEEKTLKRIDQIMNNAHHSVYEHTFITLNIENIPKILAMFLNNEKEYTTSEKSLRYTRINEENEFISEEEIKLYNKWFNIFNEIITSSYGEYFNKSKINNLSKENARYFTTVFIPTKMIYTTSLRQLNYICAWMRKYINESKTDFEKKTSIYMQEFICKLDELNILDERLMTNDKNRNLSLFTNKKPYSDYFSDVYKTSYKGSFAEFAQLQRHRTIDYQMSFLDNYEYFVPPILNRYSDLKTEWNTDMKSVENVFPQGELVSINERGTYENFILKCKERLCSAAQFEVMMQTKETLTKYGRYLQEQNDELFMDILKYSHGARCTFPDYKCSQDCKFPFGKILIRKI